MSSHSIRHYGGKPNHKVSVTLWSIPPDLQSVGMIPASPTSQDDITCIPVAQDIDGDVLSYDFTWAIDGNVVQTGSWIPC